MKEYLVKIPEGEEEVLVAVMEKFGAEVTIVPTRQNEIASKKVTNKEAKSFKKKQENPLTQLFGKWKDFDIDPNKLREEAWDRSRKF